MTPVEIFRGTSPVILGQPHGGTFVPPVIASKLNNNGRLLADTDWHIGKLYDGLLPAASIVKATFHRYVIDANRDPIGHSLYPGQNTTGLCPLTDFDGLTIWSDGKEPNAAEVADRIENYHAPYHQALQTEIERVKNLHGIAVVFDCHSIRSRIPFLFEGELPVFNIGTDGGKTCASSVEEATYVMAKSSQLPTVLNGRFRGGWTTRHYGKPDTHVHAIQMEIAQRSYLEMEAAPWTYSESKADQLRPRLKDILRVIADTASEISKHV